jgi:hypothetical protein
MSEVDYLLTDLTNWFTQVFFEELTKIGDYLRIVCRQLSQILTAPIVNGDTQTP